MLTEQEFTEAERRADEIEREIRRVKDALDDACEQIAASKHLALLPFVKELDASKDRRLLVVAAAAEDAERVAAVAGLVGVERACRRAKRACVRAWTLGEKRGEWARRQSRAAKGGEP